MVSVYDVVPRILPSQQSKIDAMPLEMKNKEPTLTNQNNDSQTNLLTQLQVKRRRWRMDQSAKRMGEQRERVKGSKPGSCSLLYDPVRYLFSGLGRCKVRQTRNLGKPISGAGTASGGNGSVSAWARQGLRQSNGDKTTGEGGT